MSESPELVTHRLRIVPFSERFITPRYPAWLNDPEVVRYSSQRRTAHTIESCLKYLKSYDATPHYFWAILENGDGLRHIGNMNAYVDPVDLVADLGILLGERAVWGRGYAREAWVAVCDHLFRSAGMRKITAGACAENAPMLAVMRACGMIEDGRRVRQMLVDGREVDVIHAALFHETWQMPVSPSNWPRK